MLRTAACPETKVRFSQNDSLQKYRHGLTAITETWEYDVRSSKYPISDNGQCFGDLNGAQTHTELHKAGSRPKVRSEEEPRTVWVWRSGVHILLTTSKREGTNRAFVHKYLDC